MAGIARAALVILLVSGVVAAEPMVAVRSQSPGDPGFSYLVYEPQGTPPDAGWPLVLSLHGFGLRGDDLSKLLEYGLPRAIHDGLRPRMVVVAPQLTGLSWRDDDIDAFLRWIVSRHRIDGARIYGTGVSLGGAGIWNFAARRPGWLAAMAPIAGAGHPELGSASRSTPVWAFHGTADLQVPIERQREAVAAHARLSGTARLTEFPGAGHDAFTREVFIDNDLLGWFAKHQRSETAPPPPRRTQVPVGAASGPTPRWDGRLELPTQEHVMAWIDAFTRFPHRRPGSDHGIAAEAWLAGQLTDFGIRVDTQAVEVNRWEPQSWSLELDGRQVPGYPVMYTPFTGPAGLVAPLVSVGRGRAADFAGLDVRGKVVVIDAAISSRTMLDPARVLYAQDPARRFARPVEHVGYPGNFLGGFADRTLLRGMDAVLRASEAGASGFIMILDGHAPGIASLAWPYDGVVSRIPGFYVPAAHGAMVRAATAGAEGIRLRSEGLTGRGSMRNIIAVMPGRSPRAVIVGSHHDAPGRGVIEDATGTVAVLALAKAWSRLPPMERPCTVVFALCGGHFARGEGAYRLAAAYPRLMDGARAVLVLEHLAGREVSFDAAGGYAVLPTRQPSTLYVSPHPEMAAIARLSLEAAPQPPVTVEQPLLGIPLTDVAGYVAATKIASTGGRSGLPYISWISAPPYLVDEGDQRDKLDPRDYMSALAAAEEMLRHLVALPENFNAAE